MRATRDVRALVLRPLHGGILHRHRLAVGAKLHPQVPFAALRAKQSQQRLAQAVGLAGEVDRPIRQGPQVSGGRRQ